MSETAPRTSLSTLQSFIQNAFVAVGMPHEEAGKAAALMAQADLIGQDGHGVSRLPMYIKRIQAGGLNVKPDFKIIEERAATALIDGDNGLGHLVMQNATELAMKKAETTGVAWVGARHSNHAGPASLYAMMPLKKDMIGLYVAVGSANHLPPWGGTEMLLSTNPIAVAIPSGANPPIILDMATTVAAYGKVKTAAQRGETMPEGWMVDKDGNPLTDPSRASEGFLLPIGGAKGYGLALIFGILAGTLNGAAFGRDVIDFNADSKKTTNTGHFILALDIKAFADPKMFKASIDNVWAEMKSSELMTGVSEIRLPGERLAQVTQDRTDNGIPLAPALRETLKELAADLGIAPL
ncbi:Malate/lactate/ureidoglycolate dehydrogenase, LDH2 family [Octadecabacter temperatus]|uniref:Putative oxidoreductase YjmC n=1 Tax=Octadecabacter temperatus TaxID=1458307 RepID=A0A0K0Y3B7_9RHOB|nr:Ldh family oxidoreductase [Octadecabacter temperatus]AKS45371.1 putative oxidoreductase YjmC [Octadecabacter temperatus]SIN91490.1 Malate/lactate/ureidoglycolate dehydrogenase, LDH2 family [Octadecabacter temperatus]